MKIEVTYYELKRKEFRKKSTLQKFLRSHLPSEILTAYEYKDKICYALELKEFIVKYRGNNETD